jgi:hypothetical protein
MQTASIWHQQPLHAATGRQAVLCTPPCLLDPRQQQDTQDGMVCFCPPASEHRYPPLHPVQAPPLLLTLLPPAVLPHILNNNLWNTVAADTCTSHGNKTGTPRSTQPTCFSASTSRRFMPSSYNSAAVAAAANCATPDSTTATRPLKGCHSKYTPLHMATKHIRHSRGENPASQPTCFSASASRRFNPSSSNSAAVAAATTRCTASNPPQEQNAQATCHSRHLSVDTATNEHPRLRKHIPSPPASQHLPAAASCRPAPTPLQSLLPPTVLPQIQPQQQDALKGCHNRYTPLHMATKHIRNSRGENPASQPTCFSASASRRFMPSSSNSAAVAAAANYTTPDSTTATRRTEGLSQLIHTPAHGNESYIPG